MKRISIAILLSLALAACRPTKTCPTYEKIAIMKKIKTDYDLHKRTN